jgi:BirA family biotin operon repressor/biotin-[acetyl-CoA-carboxylase] ligase
LLANFGVPAKIKWPNDIYVNDRKIAGVLIENVIQGKMITRSIIGIGLNVNQRDFGGLPATSLSLENNMHYSIDDVLFSFISVFNKRLKEIEAKSTEEGYHELLYQLDEKRRFEDSEGEFEGIIQGVVESGKLSVSRNGVVQEFNLKEIKFLS